MTVSQFNTPSKTIRRSEQYHKKILNFMIYDGHDVMEADNQPSHFDRAPAKKRLLCFFVRVGLVAIGFET
jgi:hypothetical protein